MEDLISINEEALDKLTLDLYDYSDRINSILNQINDLINYSTTYFKGNEASEILKKYSDFKLVMDNVKYNFSTYSSDLVAVKNKFRNNASNIATDVNKRTRDIQSM